MFEYRPKSERSPIGCLFIDGQFLSIIPRMGLNAKEIITFLKKEKLLLEFVEFPNEMFTLKEWEDNGPLKVFFYWVNQIEHLPTVNLHLVNPTAKIIQKVDVKFVEALLKALTKPNAEQQSLLPAEEHLDVLYTYKEYVRKTELPNQRLAQLFDQARLFHVTAISIAESKPQESERIKAILHQINVKQVSPARKLLDLAKHAELKKIDLFLRGKSKNDVPSFKDYLISLNRTNKIKNALVRKSYFRAKVGFFGLGISTTFMWLNYGLKHLWLMNSIKTTLTYLPQIFNETQITNTTQLLQNALECSEEASSFNTYLKMISVSSILLTFLFRKLDNTQKTQFTSYIEADPEATEKLTTLEQVNSLQEGVKSRKHVLPTCKLLTFVYSKEYDLGAAAGKLVVVGLDDLNIVKSAEKKLRALS